MGDGLVERNPQRPLGPSRLYELCDVYIVRIASPMRFAITLIYLSAGSNEMDDG